MVVVVVVVVVPLLPLNSDDWAEAWLAKSTRPIRKKAKAMEVRMLAVVGECVGRCTHCQSRGGGRSAEMRHARSHVPVVAGLLSVAGEDTCSLSG